MTLPYEPVQFVLTQTIGLPITQNENNQHRQLDYKYKDILVPKPMGLQNVHMYYLFHVGAVYNWLRGIQLGVAGKGCQEREQLNEYIQGKVQGKEQNQNQQKLGRFQLQVNNKVKVQFKLQDLYERILQYAKKWQIVKICTNMKIMITKPCKISNSQLCRHMIKMQTWTPFYTYNELTHILKPQKFYCKQCEKWINIENDTFYEIKQYPITPIFNNKFHGLNFKTNNQEYLLIQAYSNSKIWIKSANSCWYTADVTQKNISNVKLCVNSEEIAKNKNNQMLCVYVKKELISNCGMLKQAVSFGNKNQHVELQNEQVNTKSIQDIFKMSKSKSKIKQISTKKQTNLPSNVIQFQSRMHKMQEKQLKQLAHQQQQNNKKVQTNHQMIDQKHQIVGQLSEIPQNRYNVNRHIVVPNSLGNSANKYRNFIQKLYQKPKQKDDYEKDYDKGKTKKIKKKVDYAKPNYNQVFKEVKEANKEIIVQAQQAQKQGLTLRQKQKQKQKKLRKEQQRSNQGSFGGRNDHRNSNRNGKVVGGRKQFKQWKKQKKQNFAQRFQSS